MFKGHEEHPVATSVSICNYEHYFEEYSVQLHPSHFLCRALFVCTIVAILVHILLYVTHSSFGAQSIMDASDRCLVLLTVSRIVMTKTIDTNLRVIFTAGSRMTANYCASNVLLSFKKKKWIFTSSSLYVMLV